MRQHGKRVGLTHSVANSKFVIQGSGMKSWQVDLLEVAENASDEHAIFERIAAAAKSLGFEHCAYGLRVPLPVSNPKTVMLNNYPVAWQQRYQEAQYLNIDPTVLHCRRTHIPLIWNDDIFKSTPQLWEEAKMFGLRHGWAKSSLDGNGVGGMLTLARSQLALTPSELEANELKMRWLVNIAHLALARVVMPQRAQAAKFDLTEREREVLKWTADGKTSGEISDILSVSENTVNFHIKNAISKLQAANKTAAAVRAAMLGLLN
jgi:LuxR family quorum-sensing system transcriptional regulator SolR